MQIQYSVESLGNKMEQVENSVSGIDDKAKELDQSMTEKVLRKYERNLKSSGTQSKDQSYELWS
jgi:predicted  nucleic acid-binding Zn-ribbon protein